jgi:hypothetical protein
VKSLPISKVKRRQMNEQRQLWILAVSLPLVLAAGEARAQTCTPATYSGNVTAGDGSTIPGNVEVLARFVGGGQFYPVYQGPAGAFSANGPAGGNGGQTANIENAAYNGSYFWPPSVSVVTCNSAETWPYCWTCSGSPQFQLFAAEGALQGKVTVVPSPPSLANIPVFLARAGASTPGYVYT